MRAGLVVFASLLAALAVASDAPATREFFSLYGHGYQAVIGEQSTTNVTGVFSAPDARSCADMCTLLHAGSGYPCDGANFNQEGRRRHSCTLLSGAVEEERGLEKADESEAVAMFLAPSLAETCRYQTPGARTKACDRHIAVAEPASRTIRNVALYPGYRIESTPFLSLFTLNSELQCRDVCQRLGEHGCTGYTYATLPVSRRDETGAGQCLLFDVDTNQVPETLVAKLSDPARIHPGAFLGSGILGSCTQYAGIMTMSNYLPECIDSNAKPRDAGLDKKKKKRGRDQVRLHPCPEGLRACRLQGSSFAFECVDRNELNSCGGCLSEGTGVDCEAVPGVAIAACVEDECQALRCLKGWHIGLSGRCRRD